MNPVLNLILTHQSAKAVSKMLRYWNDYAPPENILLAYGGTKPEFDAIPHPAKMFIDDSTLRTKDHQRELQSYTGIFQRAAGFLESRPQFQYVHFLEFDHVPLVRDLNQRQIQKLIEEKADVLGFHLHRVDGTNNAHFLYHQSQPGFGAYWQQMTRRTDPGVVLSMFGSGSFWTREAFCAVAGHNEPFRIYLELYLPTLAHHLGYRVRGFADQERFVQVLRDATDQVDQARARAAWTLHPVKFLWN